MEGQEIGTGQPRPLAAIWTNILAGLWGAVAAYILFDSLLISHRNRYAFAAVFPLISAWATLERKRWGRLALMGLSVTTVLMFAILSGLFTRFYHPWQAEALTLGNGATALIVAYGIGTATAIGLLALAAITGFWLCLPGVAAAFNQNKRATLVKAQRGIAMVVVICWGAVIAIEPLRNDNNDKSQRDNYLRTGLRVKNGFPLRSQSTHRSPDSSSNFATRSAADRSKP